ncbi:MAG: ABC transporter substrate-binding protein [Thiolinea sp.]
MSITQVQANDIPQRVVSMNLCTDQLALMLAKTGQLKAVTWMAQDPSMSVMAEQARQLPAHRGTAEEVYSLSSDLVLTGTYTNQATLDMLKHLGRRVVAIPPAFSFADIRKNMQQVGDVLGQSVLAAELVAAFDKHLSRVKISSDKKNILDSKRLSATSYGANLYMQGANSLEKDMVESAGFAHYGTQSQLGDYGGRVSLEQLVMSPPDVLLMSNYQQHEVRAYQHLVHPALDKLVPARQRADTQPRNWTCGTPLVLETVAKLAELRKKLEGGNNMDVVDEAVRQ